MSDNFDYRVYPQALLLTPEEWRDLAAICHRWRIDANEMEPGHPVVERRSRLCDHIEDVASDHREDGERQMSGYSQIRVQAHLEPLEAAQAIIRLRQALWDCLVASGADTSGYDGPENWPGGTSLEDVAVGAVKELASDYEQVLFDR